MKKTLFCVLLFACCACYDNLWNGEEDLMLASNTYKNLTDGAIYAFGSSLTDGQKQRLNIALNEFVNKHPLYARMFEDLSKEGGIKFEINLEEMEKAHGNAGYRNGTIMFRDANSISIEHLAEEMIHAVQDLCIYGQNYMDEARKNIEFEAKVIQDLVGISSPQGWVLRGSIAHDNVYMDAYEGLIRGFRDMTFPEFIEKFDDLCVRWHGYGGTYQSIFQPRTIMMYYMFLR